MKTVYRIGGAIAAWFALILQYFILLSNIPSDKSAVSQTIFFLSFMTIWTNILVALAFTVPMISPESKLGLFLTKPSVAAAVARYISMVAIAYHFLLAELWQPTGLQWLADTLLHYGVPVLYTGYWILFAQKGFLKVQEVFLWLVYPLIYFVYALTRGVNVHEYPYPVIDVTQHGYSGVLVSSLFLMIGFIVLGLIIFGIDRFSVRKIEQ